MTTALVRVALRARGLASILPIIVAIGCAGPGGGGGPEAAAGESHAAGRSGSAAVGQDEPATPSLEDTIDLFLGHYAQRLGTAEAYHRAIPGGEEISITSPRLKGPGNEPQLLVHAGGPTEDVIVLCHGLSDSPHYMRAVADRFFAAGANVVLPLLPAHGLVDPDEAMEDSDLDRKWVAAFDGMMDLAIRFFERLPERTTRQPRSGSRQAAAGAGLLLAEPSQQVLEFR